MSKYTDGQILMANITQEAWAAAESAAKTHEGGFTLAELQAREKAWNAVWVKKARNVGPRTVTTHALFGE